MFQPGLLDRLLATKAWQGQLAEEPLEPERIDNLYSPLPADFGAHGRFDNEAKSASWQVRAARHPLLHGLLATALAFAAWRLRNPSRP